LTDAGDVLGINLHCLEFVNNNAKRVHARPESLKILALDITDIKKEVIGEFEMKKEVIDEGDIKKELSEDVTTNLISEEIVLSLQARRYEVGVGCKEGQRVMDPPEHAEKTPHTVCTSKKRKNHSPAKIRRSIRRAMLHKAKKGENDSGQNLDKLAVVSSKKVDLYQSPQKSHFRTSQHKDEQYPRAESPQLKWVNTTYKSIIRGNRESAWQDRHPEYAEYHKSKPIDSWKSRRNEKEELMRKVAEKSPSTLTRQREQNSSYILEEGEIE